MFGTSSMTRMTGAPPPPYSPGPSLTLKSVATFPDAYAWYVLACALDLMLTLTVIARFGAREVNAVAEAAIAAGGHSGLIALKVGSMGVVIVVCELIARRNVKAASRVAEWAVVVAALPVILTMAQIMNHPSS
jgi:Domain of unknown function (DUF5658)